MGMKLNNLNYENVIKEFNSDINCKINSINSIVCFDDSASKLLKIIGRVIDNIDGEIKFSDEMETAVYIPTDPASFPWLNVEDNIKYVLENSTHLSNKIENNILQIINDVGLNGYEKHFSDNNSLGFRFRISIARALVFNSILILIDNSFCVMDDETKFELFDMIKSISKKYDVSFLINTKNISDAIYLSENIYLMKEGKETFLDSINLLEEWKELGSEDRRSRQQKIVEKIINIFTKNNLDNIQLKL
ncbi:MAG: hypothetical protein CO128_04170 [Ignavibacteriales bacterium CG_4_9_14_3_um_filter_30_11]|nr:MAG: hypothetical protein CO128_04170 [Ignavibacteriales bacterium CG_4_9_14_3_um_filter_30_11]